MKALGKGHEGRRRAIQGTLTTDQTTKISQFNSSALQSFFRQVAASPESALLLDFDGTLAPFRVDRFRAKPWSGVTEILDAIYSEGRTRLAIITGRPASEALSLLGMKSPIEVWGLHGGERLHPDGLLEHERLTEAQQDALMAARRAVDAAHLGLLVEDKPNAVVVHWRGVSPRLMSSLQAQVVSLLRHHRDSAGLQMLIFDGGVELRTGRNKGDAVRNVLAEISDAAPVAYLGDDTTDEDAFRALAGRGLGVLVRKQERQSAARLWLKPPGQLREFLKSWLAAIRR